MICALKKSVLPRLILALVGLVFSPTAFAASDEPCDFSGIYPGSLLEQAGVVFNGSTASNMEFLKESRPQRLKALVAVAMKDKTWRGDGYLQTLSRILKDVRAVPITWEEFYALRPLAKTDNDWKFLTDLLFYSTTYIETRDGLRAAELRHFNAHRYVEFLGQIDRLSMSNSIHQKIVPTLLRRVIVNSVQEDREAIAAALADRIRKTGPQEAARIRQGVIAEERTQRNATALDHLLADNNILEPLLGFSRKEIIEALKKQPESPLVVAILRKRIASKAMGDREIHWILNELVGQNEEDHSRFIHTLNAVLSLPDWEPGIKTLADERIVDLLKIHLGLGSPEAFAAFQRRLTTGETTLADAVKELSVGLYLEPDFLVESLDSSSPELAKHLVELLNNHHFPPSHRKTAIGVLVRADEAEEAVPFLNGLSHQDRVAVLKENNRRWEIAYWDKTTLDRYGITAEDAQEILSFQISRLGSPQEAERELQKIIDAFGGEGVPKQTLDALLLWAPSQYFGVSVVDAADLRQHLTTAAERGSIPLSKKSVDHLLNFTNRVDLIGQLLRAYYFSEKKEGHSSEPKAVISRAIGISEKSLSSEGFSKHGRYAEDFAQILLNIQERLSSPMFQNLEIDPKVFQGENFEQLNRILDAIRARLFFQLAVEGNGAKADRTVAEILSKSGLHGRPLTAHDLSRVEARVNEDMQHYFQQQFSQVGIEIEAKDLEKLKGEHGDFLPIQVLIGRMAANSDWKRGLPTLGQVFRHMLDGDFPEYKYEGKGGAPGDVEKSAWQLRSLPEGPKREAWKAEYSEVSVWNESGKETGGLLPEFRLAALSDNAKRFRAHLPNLVIPEGDVQRRIVDRVLAAQTPISKLLPELRRLSHEGESAQADQVILSSLSQGLVDAKDVPSALLLSRRLNELFHPSNNFSVKLDRDAAGNLEDIVRDAKSSPKKTGEAIVVTCTFSDPRLLLKIGSLVSDTSCQNYRTGTFIGTLLGYVIDANVKGIYGTVLKPYEFKSLADYHRVQKAILSGTEIKAEVDGKDLSIHFEWAKPDGTTVRVSSSSQNFGFRRHVLKMGTSVVESGGAGLALEPAFRSSTPAEAELERQSNAVVTKVANATGATVGETTEHGASKNIGGVYSDNAETKVNTVDYVIPGVR